MKICDLVQMYTPRSGGIHTYISAKQNHIISKTQAEHILIVPGKNDSFTENGRLRVYEIASPLIPGCQPYRFIWRLDKVFRVLRKEKPHIIELGSAYITPWIAFLYRLFHKCPVVGYYHTDYPDAYVKPWISQRFGKIIGTRAADLAACYARATYNLCDTTIVASKQITDKLTSRGHKRLVSIPLGVDPTLFHPEKRDQAIRQRFLSSPDQTLLIYTGRLDSEKQVTLLTQTLRLLPDNQYALLMIGDGPLRDELHKAATNLPNLHILPYQSNKQDLAAHLASADIYITAGPYETFSLSVLEAQACALPVVGVNSGALIDRVPEQTGLLAKPESAPDLAEAVCKLNPQIRTSFSRNSRNLIEHHYTWDYVCHAILNCYHACIQAKARKRKSILQRFLFPHIKLSSAETAQSDV